MKKVVFTFGRMNPPTAGHERLITKVVETARVTKAYHIVYLSHTQNNKTDPLDWNFKLRVCDAAFKGVNISEDESIRNPFHALGKLCEQYDHITLVVGSDQLKEFKPGMTKYATEQGVKFKVISAGERLDESDDMVENISATKIRKYALENNKKKFFEGMPSTLKPAIMELVYKNVQKGLKKPR